VFCFFHLRGLDGDAAFLLILAGVCESGFACLCASNDTGLRHERVCQCGLSVVYVRNDGHVADVPLFVHHDANLVYCEVHLENNEDVCDLASPRDIFILYKSSTKF
jgi:hypothetical protein